MLIQNMCHEGRPSLSETSKQNSFTSSLTHKHTNTQLYTLVQTNRSSMNQSIKPKHAFYKAPSVASESAALP